MKQKFLRHKQLYLLFGSNLIVLSVGMGLFPVLSLYAAELGADPGMIGLFYAAIYVVSIASSVITSRLAGRVSANKLFIAAGIAGSIVQLLLGQAQTFWQLVLLTALLWFSGSISITLVNLLTGAVAGEESRGISFTLINLAYPVGAVVGGTMVGALVQRQGYSFMFSALGIFWLAQPVLSLLAVKVINNPALTAGRSKQTAQSSVSLGKNFYLLLAAFLFSAIAISVARLGTSLSMGALTFSPGQVASTATVSGLVSIPVVLLLGAWSDRLGYKRILMVGYLLAAWGVATLILASQLWHFLVAAVFIMVAFNTNFSVSAAFVTTLLEPAALNRGLPLLNATDSMAGTLSFVVMGFMMESIGAPVLYSVAAVLALGAALQLARLHIKESAVKEAPVVDEAMGRLTQTPNINGQCVMTIC